MVEKTTCSKLQAKKRSAELKHNKHISSEYHAGVPSGTCSWVGLAIQTFNNSALLLFLQLTISPTNAFQ
jgi:hypothetical protein